MLDTNLANQTAVVTNQNTHVPVVVYREQRVITTEQLGVGYGATSQQITNNFNRNKSRFIEGKHYYRVEGEEVEILRNSFRGVQISNKARSFYLWTERGASRHAKILETDQAWDYYELLEDTYFRVRSERTPGNYIEALECLLASEKEKVAIAAERDHAIETKAWIGHRREATAMATASAAARERNKLAEKLGESKNRATILAVERLMGKKYQWHPLKKWCIENKTEPHLVHDDRYGTVNSWPAGAWLAVYGIDLSKLL